MRQITQKDAQLCREVLHRFSCVDREIVILSSYLSSAPPAVISAVGVDKTAARKIRSFVSVMGSLGFKYFYLRNPRTQVDGVIVYDVFAVPQVPLDNAIDIDIFNSALCQIFDIDFVEVLKSENQI